MGFRNTLQALYGAFFAIAVLAALACSDEHVTVGDAVAVVNLSECYGAGTDCGGFDDVSQEDLLDGEAQLCPLEHEPARSTAWTDLLDAVVLVAATDESNVFWTASREREDGLGPVHVRRYAEDGELLSEVDIDLMIEHDHARHWQLDLVAKPRGGATLSAQVLVSDRATSWRENLWMRVIELDDAGEVASAPLEVAGIEGGLDLSSAKDGALLVGGYDAAGASVLGRLAIDGQVAWVQTALHSRLTDAFGTASGGAYVLGTRPSETPLEHTQSLAFYDAQGNLAWDREPPFTASFEPIGVDEAGNLTVLGYMDELDPAQVMLIEVDPDGDSRWAALLPEVSVLRGPMTFDGEGTLSFSSYDVDQRLNTIYQVSADGSQCWRSEVLIEGANVSATQFWTMSDGTTFFVSEVDGKPLRVIGALRPR